MLTRNDLLGRSIDEFLRLGSEALREEYRFVAKASVAWAKEHEEKVK